MFPFKLSLNTSTLFPFQLGLEDQIRIAAEAGYEGIEIWVRDVDAYLDNGGTLSQLRRFIADSGIQLVNAIAFWTWMDKDDRVRETGLIQAAREMEMLAELYCIAVAAPPYGNVGGVSLNDSAASFAKLTELARGIGIEPYLEFWGRAQQLSHVRAALYVAELSGLTEAKLLLDPFHMYTGGSVLTDLAGITGERIGIVHVNDYPNEPPREQIADLHRIFPGDGIAPTSEFAKLLHNSGYNRFLSLELFMNDYGGMSALEVAKHGLEKTLKAYSI
jgi:2-keto-myo-inositol isomerase